MSKCAGCGEREASRLECPSCKKLGIPGSFFCDQDCFKRNWASHKLIHNIVQIAAQAESDKNQTIPSSMRNYKWTGPLRPHYPLSAKREVPAHIRGYVDTSASNQRKHELKAIAQGQSPIEMGRERAVKILNAEEIEGMRKVCRLTREVLDVLETHIRPGVTTDELDRICHEECIKRDAYPSPLNYGKFPKSVCTSVNEVICHGIPDQRPLLEGDIINLDVSLFHGGLHGDLNATYPVGKVDQESLDLIAATKRSMEAAIAICKPGVPYREVGNKIEEVIKPTGYSIVRRYTGHGVHYMFHCQPNVVHYGNSKMPGRMEAGQVFTIEPMINLGTSNLDHWKDDWTAVTMDGRRSAQFEETILITETGCEILTRPPPTSSASKKKKKKKSKAANGAVEADAEEDGAGPSGTATPTADVATGVEGLQVNGNGD